MHEQTLVWPLDVCVSSGELPTVRRHLTNKAAVLLMAYPQGSAVVKTNNRYLSNRWCSSLVSRPLLTTLQHQQIFTLDFNKYQSHDPGSIFQFLTVHPQERHLLNKRNPLSELFINNMQQTSGGMYFCRLPGKDRHRMSHGYLLFHALSLAEAPN